MSNIRKGIRVAAEALNCPASAVTHGILPPFGEVMRERGDRPILRDVNFFEGKSLPYEFVITLCIFLSGTAPGKFAVCDGKAVDGGAEMCYTNVCRGMLVWLSWQSSSLVMSRSPVRIRPQAPKNFSTPLRGAEIFCRACPESKFIHPRGGKSGHKLQTKSGTPCGAPDFVMLSGNIDGLIYSRPKPASAVRRCGARMRC